MIPVERRQSSDVRSPDNSVQPTPCILYLTADGILEPLGQSQVTAYVIGLASYGFRYEILSLEKQNDLASGEAVESMSQFLASKSVAWHWLPYQGADVIPLLKTYSRMMRAARKRVLSNEVSLVHARSYLMGLLAWVLRRCRRQQYIFDARGYWVDERAESGRWFRIRLLYRLAKSFEIKIARDAAAVVTLTDVQRDDFRSKLPGQNVITITTCVDFDRFRPDAIPTSVPLTLRVQLANALVLGLIGSINSSYRIRESLRLFRLVKELHPQAILLCLTRQQNELRALLRIENIPEESVTITTTPHSVIHEWLPLMNWGLLLLESSFAKRASMPTKLGEMFASGVRPVQYGCNEEVSALVREAGSGIVLSGTDDNGLLAAARQIVSIGTMKDGISEARERMREHFSLQAGTRKYSQVLQSSINTETSSRAPRTTGAS